MQVLKGNFLSVSGQPRLSTKEAFRGVVIRDLIHVIFGADFASAKCHGAAPG